MKIKREKRQWKSHNNNSSSNYKNDQSNELKSGDDDSVDYDGNHAKHGTDASTG